MRFHSSLQIMNVAMIFKKKSQSKTKTAIEEIQLNIQSAGRYLWFPTYSRLLKPCRKKLLYSILYRETEGGIFICYP